MHVNELGESVVFERLCERGRVCGGECLYMCVYVSVRVFLGGWG